MEHGTAPELPFKNRTLVLPEIGSGNPKIDQVIQEAWLGHYSHTSEMLQQLISIDAQTNHFPESVRPFPESMGLFKEKIRKWRSHRQIIFGKTSPYRMNCRSIWCLTRFQGCVLAGILSENELKALANRYDIDMDADSRFTHYRMPL